MTTEAATASFRDFPTELSAGSDVLSSQETATIPAETFSPFSYPFTNRLSITAEKEAELNAREAALDAREAALHKQIARTARINMMGEFAIGLAHELNQPLAATVNFLGAAGMLVRNEADRALIERTLERASDQALRAGDIIRRLRDFVTTRDHEAHVHFVEPVVRDAVELACTGRDGLGVALTYAFDPDARSMLADRIQVQQVLVNLLRNSMEALQAAPTGKRTINIRTGAVDRESLEIAIDDTGPGLPDHVLTGVGAPFVSGNGTNGMGVGLSICRRIVEGQGGEFRVGNLAQGGASVRFTVPMITAEELQEA